MKTTTLELQVKSIEEAIKKLNHDIKWFELDDEDYIEEYEDCLDCEGPVIILGYYYDTSRVLKEVDPIAYRCGLSDYVYGLDKECSPEYVLLTEKLEELEEELEELQEELDEALESEEE
jgi:hypothetical protein